MMSKSKVKLTTALSLVACILLGVVIFFTNNEILGVHNSKSGRSMNNSSIGEPTNLKHVDRRTSEVGSHKILRADSVEDWLEQLAGTPYGDDYQTLLVKIASYYGESDPEGGKKWLGGLQNSPEHLVAFTTFGSHFAQSFGISALDFFYEIKHESFREGFLTGVIPTLAFRNPSEMVLFAIKSSAQIKHPESTYRSIGNFAALEDFGIIVELASTEGLPDSGRDAVLFGGLLRIMSEENWATAMSDFLTQVSGDDDNERMIKLVDSLVGATSQSGFTDLSTVLESLPASSARDSGISKFSKRVASIAPDSAVFWLNKIVDDSLRFRTAVQVLQETKKFDSGLARELREGVVLPDDLKNKLPLGNTD